MTQPPPSIRSEDIDKIREMRLSGSSIRKIMKSLNLRYSRGTVHSAVKSLDAEDNPDDTELSNDSQEEGKDFHPNDPFQKLYESTIELWRIDPSTFFRIGREAINAGYDNVGEFIVKEVLPWIRFSQDMSQDWELPVEPKILRLAFHRLIRESIELQEFKKRLNHPNPQEKPSCITPRREHSLTEMIMRLYFPKNS